MIISQKETKLVYGTVSINVRKSLENFFLGAYMFFIVTQNILFTLLFEIQRTLEPIDFDP